MKRQKIRKLLLLVSLLLFPITMWYFSPAIIIVALAKHILSGSFFLFAAMLVFSMVCGRVFCGYLCPAGGLQECVAMVKNEPAKGGWRNYIKFGIWALWLIVLGIVFFTGTGDIVVNPLFMTERGISIHEISDFITYYGVLTLLFVPALLHGRRATCHYLCWMAPFMMTGAKIGQFLHLPQLHVEADLSKCVSCKACNRACVMGLDVEKMIHEKGRICGGECANCGSCIDNCPKKVLKYSFKWR